MGFARGLRGGRPGDSGSDSRGGFTRSDRSRPGGYGLPGGGSGALFYGARNKAWRIRGASPQQEGSMTFPAQRPRRLRRTEALRSMTRETRLSTSGFVYPMFVGPGTGTRVEIG